MCQARTDDTHVGTREVASMPCHHADASTSTSPNSSPADSAGAHIPVKSTKRRQAEMRAQLRAKRTRSFSSLAELGDSLTQHKQQQKQQQQQQQQRKKTTRKPEQCPKQLYKAVLSHQSCPHLARWLLETEDGIDWDWEGYYRSSETIVVEDEVLIPDALQFLTRDQPDGEKTIVTIDLEWRPDYTRVANNPVALIQLATTTRCILLRTTSWDTTKGLPEPLRQFFQGCANRYFVGFSWDGGDEKKMRCTFGVGKEVFSNFVDLQVLAHQLGYGKKCGLSALTKEVLRAELPKSAKVARSNWEAKELSGVQTEYAALDVFSLHAILHWWRSVGGL